MKITFRDVTPCSLVTILKIFWGKTSACISKISVNILPGYTASDHNFLSNRASGTMEMFVIS